MALTSTFSRTGGFVQLVSNGTGWSTVTTVTITRAVVGQPTVPVRGWETARAVSAGVFVTSDNEAPLDATVVYAATGYDVNGTLVGTITTTVTTPVPGDLWGLWVKAPGRADLNVRCGFSDAGDLSQAVQGGTWDIPGGARVSEAAGMTGITSSLTVTTKSAAQLAALRAVVNQAPGQVVLLQTGQPEELPSGYYQVSGISQSNPTNQRSDRQAYRVLTLQVAQVLIPAGNSTGFSGVTHDTIRASFATHQAIKTAGKTHFDLATGNF